MSTRISQLSGLPKLTLEDARHLTGLDLVAARDVQSSDGASYHDMEAETESKSHDIVREEGIGFFVSLGYKVFTEGVGVRGTYTLADFLAVRDRRVVFVEVLSDSNIKQETLERKAQLQKHGELCFIFFSGTKRSDDASLRAKKQAIEDWADVLYCRLHGYSGNFIQYSGRTTVEYDTTRQNGISVALTFEKAGRKLMVSVQFLNHLYRSPMEIPLSYMVGNISYRYENTFLSVFQRFAKLSGGTIKYRSLNHDTTIRAMRRKTGLRLLNGDGAVLASLRSDYRGDEPDPSPGMSDYHPSSRDFPLEHFYGLFTLEKTGEAGLHQLLDALRHFRLTPIFDEAAFRAALLHLSKQPTTEP